MRLIKALVIECYGTATIRYLYTFCNIVADTRIIQYAINRTLQYGQYRIYMDCNILEKKYITMRKHRDIKKAIIIYIIAKKNPLTVFRQLRDFFIYITYGGTVIG